MKKHILIVGSGSIGQRHAVNLSNLGCIISCIDLRDDRISEIKSKVNINLSFNSFIYWILFFIPFNNGSFWAIILYEFTKFIKQ